MTAASDESKTREYVNIAVIAGNLVLTVIPEG